MNPIDAVMRSSTRRLLCVDPYSILQPHHAKLTEQGWDIVLARNRVELERYIREYDHDIGLLCLDDVGFAEDVLAVDQSMHWIAVVSDKLLVEADIQRLVACHFYDYHRLPIDIGRLTTTLGRASGIAGLRHLYQEHVYQEQPGNGSPDRFIGDSTHIREIKKNITRVAAKDFPVLVSGESGTGKELIARAIHDQSNRSGGPFVAVNCGALPNTLIQSELFGHEKGAFTGADRMRIGRFEAASGGTLFLDEIGDLSLDVQVNLLRVLEQGIIERIGDNRSRPVDVRVVTATNIDLDKAVREGSFRKDLYYRINVFQLNVLPLRERGDDLLKLAESFLSQVNGKSPVKQLSRHAVEAMYAYGWPGNVRELINRIQQAQVSCDSTLILPEHLGLESLEESKNRNGGPTLEDARNQAEKTVLTSALRRNSYNISKVSRELGVSRVTLYRLLKKHHIELSPSPDVRPSEVRHERSDQVDPVRSSLGQ